MHDYKKHINAVKKARTFARLQSERLNTEYLSMNATNSTPDERWSKWKQSADADGAWAILQMHAMAGSLPRFWHTDCIIFYQRSPLNGSNQS